MQIKAIFMFKTGHIILILLLFSLLFSCTPRKKQIYMSKGAAGAGSSNEKNILNYKLTTGDLLFVRIQTLDEKTYKLFNSMWMNSAAISESSLFIESYTVSDSGQIEIPLLGRVNVIGLTVEEARTLIQNNIDNYLLDAVVNLKLINFKVTVLGEVNKPGTFKILDNRVNLLEVLSLAGDMTVFGNRERVMVLRKSENNKTAYLDLTDINVINSEFFYLMPNDVIYIEPTVSKTFGFREFPWAIIFSGVTTVIVLINFLNKP